MGYNFSDDFLIKENSKFEIKKHNTSYKGNINKDEAKQLLEIENEKLRVLQEKLYADGSQSLLIILQAMDAAGKDSLIEHVFGGVNPQGCEVTSFKTPSSKEYSHDFLWRQYHALPEKGKIGIFNRSHYESVLVCKVHPEYNLSEKVWKDVKQFDKKFWENRYESIRNFEKHLANNGTKIIKIFLNVSKEEQKQRFLDRINEGDKNWKFSSGDITERGFWDDYMKAYEQVINETSTASAPWFVIPADQKWFSRVAAIQIIIDKLDEMNLQYPKLSENEKNGLAESKAKLESEK
ncbi:polyphosphate kinase 2 family protein [Epilithonimonas hungarica]|uniref:Polyphosphate:nucleotide phosphotransferase, PPK2 family n=1 Tax=Epilithonimonas hungarica TaxID=454006 RepID=A0A1G7NII5_9FLAO|nr:polyphosphate kinase 2 family protein [Epilithonimonas hungarica]SDF73060.1 polyphosphate:nucleotide phosphotransferase, PPK2 family [Epilithonimonas hungarica]